MLLNVRISVIGAQDHVQTERGTGRLKNGSNIFTAERMIMMKSLWVKFFWENSVIPWCFCDVLNWTNSEETSSKNARRPHVDALWPLSFVLLKQKLAKNGRYRRILSLGWTSPLSWAKAARRTSPAPAPVQVRFVRLQICLHNLDESIKKLKGFMRSMSNPVPKEDPPGDRMWRRMLDDQVGWVAGRRAGCCSREEAPWICAAASGYGVETGRTSPSVCSHTSTRLSSAARVCVILTPHPTPRPELSPQTALHRRTAQLAEAAAAAAAGEPPEAFPCGPRTELRAMDARWTQEPGRLQMISSICPNFTTDARVHCAAAKRTRDSIQHPRFWLLFQRYLCVNFTLLTTITLIIQPYILIIMRCNWNFWWLIIVYIFKD